MEVKVFYKEDAHGVLAVESHRIPEYAGRTRTETSGGDAGVDVTESDVDLVADAVETVRVVPGRGIFLSRRMRFGAAAERFVGAGSRPAPVDHSVRVVDAERMGDVDRLAVDGEVIWPEAAAEEAGLEGQVAMLEDMVREVAST